MPLSGIRAVKDAIAALKDSESYSTYRRRLHRKNEPARRNVEAETASMKYLLIAEQEFLKNHSKAILELAVVHAERDLEKAKEYLADAS